MVQQVNVKCTIMLFFTDITCFQPDLTEVAPLNISGKFKFHNFIVPIKSQIFKPQHLYNLVCCTYFCFYAKCLKKMGNRTLGGHSINARTRRGRQVISRKATFGHVKEKVGSKQNVHNCTLKGSRKSKLGRKFAPRSC